MAQRQLGRIQRDDHASLDAGGAVMESNRGHRSSDFNVRGLYDALEEARRERGISWNTVAAEVNRRRTTLRPIAVSTITGLKTKASGEGDSILQMLIWLGRTPESFIPDVADAGREPYRLPDLGREEILRWDTKALHSAVDAERRARKLTWAGVAREVPGFTPGMLMNLAAGPRVGFPRVMRLVRWLDRPAVTFTRIARW